MFIGLAALALVAWYDINGELPSRRTASRHHTVEALNFVRDDGKFFAFERSGAGWQMTRPVTATAQPARVERLVALIDSDTSDGYAVQELNLEATGLDEPIVRMRLGEDTAVFFGATEPLSGRRYVQIEDRVILLDDQHVPLIEGGLNAFASPKLLDTPIEQVVIDNRRADSEVWENATALGVREQRDRVPSSAREIGLVIQGKTQAWRAWRDDALVVLHRDGDDIHYLISRAQATTLGIPL